METNIRQLMALLTQITHVPHVLSTSQVNGEVLYALATGQDLYLVCSDGDAPENAPRNVVNSLRLFGGSDGGSNAIDALPRTPVLIIRKLQKDELETYFGVRQEAAVARSMPQPLPVSHVGGQA